MENALKAPSVRSPAYVTPERTRSCFLRGGWDLGAAACPGAVCVSGGRMSLLGSGQSAGLTLVTHLITLQILSFACETGIATLSFSPAVSFNISRIVRHLILCKWETYQLCLR